MPRQHAIREEDQQRFLADYEDLKTITATAEKWGISQATARSTLHRLGVKDTDKRGGTLREGYHPKLGVWSDRRVAKDMGVSHQAVSNARKRRGILSAYERAMSIVNGE